MAFDLGSILSQFTGGAPGSAPADPHGSYQTVAENAPPDLVSRGLSAMFQSPNTPPFGQLAGQLFGNANPGQQAGMLGHLLSSMGPSVLASLASSAQGGALGGGLGGLISRMAQPGANPASITPAEASQVTPQQVDQIATHAEQHAPGIVDRMSDFYAQHPTLVRTLGGAALTIAMAKMAERPS